MVRCENCGLLDRTDPNGPTCVRWRKPVDDPKADRDCPVFFHLRYDGGQPYSPAEHLLLQEAEDRTRMMRGPV